MSLFHRPFPRRWTAVFPNGYAWLTPAMRRTMHQTNRCADASKKSSPIDAGFSSPSTGSVAEPGDSQGPAVSASLAVFQDIAKVANLATVDAESIVAWCERRTAMVSADQRPA